MGNNDALTSQQPRRSLADRLGSNILVLACVSLCFGAIQVFAFAPYGHWYVFFLSVLPLLWAFETLPKRSARWCAYWYGAGYWLATTHWIYNSFTHFATAPLWMSGALVALFCLAMAFFWVAFFLLWHRCSRPLGMYGYLPVPIWIKCGVFAACWLAIEWCRSTIFQGFPWLLAGYSLVDVEFAPAAAWLPIGGVWSLSFMLVLGLACVFYFLRGQITTRATMTERLPALALLAIPLGLLMASWLLPKDFSTPNGKSLRIALVQPSIPLAEKWNGAFTTRNLLILQELSAPFKERVDLIMWPESAVAGTWQRHLPLLETIGRSLAPARLASGTLRYKTLAERQTVYNSIGDFGPGFAFGIEHMDNNQQHFYDKRQLVPFGEFMPFYDYISWILHKLGFPASNLAAADKDRGLVTFGGMLFAASICYEVIFPRLLTPYAWRSEAILNISDDGWFGESLGPEQHFQMARTRAMENSRPLVRVGNDGLTALVDHQGKVLASLPRFARDALLVTVEGREGRTPFSYVGDWIVLPLVSIPLCIYFLLVIVYRRRIE